MEDVMDQTNSDKDFDTYDHFSGVELCLPG